MLSGLKEILIVHPTKAGVIVPPVNPPLDLIQFHEPIIVVSDLVDACVGKSFLQSMKNREIVVQVITTNNGVEMYFIFASRLFMPPNGPELSCGNVPLDYRSSSRAW